MRKAVIFDMYGVLLHRDFLFLRLHDTPDAAMVEILNDLKDRGVKLFLLSNIFLRSSEHFKKSYEFLALFDALYFSSDTGFVKPQPQAYEQVLREQNLEPQEVVFFDDTPANVEAANALGIEGYVFKDAQQVRDIIDKSRF